MRELAAQLAGHPRVTGFLLPTPSHLQQRLAAAVADWEVPVQVVSGESERAAAFGTAIAACAVTGTVTLELALAGVPMVTTYMADKGQAARWVKYRVKFAALPNAILDRAVVPEVLGTTVDAAALLGPLRGLLDDTAAASRQLEGFRSIRELMEVGAPEAPIEDPAKRILHWAEAQRSGSGT
jgi:lipid-A-disaccharide synthase